jgi:hypothetical protein
MSQKPQQQQIQVTVTFPIAKKPYHEDFDGSATVAQVRSAAMADFGAQEEPSTVYYLSHNGDRLPDDRTLREIHDHANGLKLRLVKELVQG